MNMRDYNKNQLGNSGEDEQASDVTERVLTNEISINQHTIKNVK